MIYSMKDKENDRDNIKKVNQALSLIKGWYVHLGKQ